MIHFWHSFANMNVLLLAVVLAVLDINEAALIPSMLAGDGQGQLAVYQGRLRVLQNILAVQCPAEDLSILLTQPDITNLAVVTSYYNALLGRLTTCKVYKPLAANSPCSSAVNLDQSWRVDRNGSHIRPGGVRSFDGYACDQHKGLQWFRFSGKGGNRMLNVCPKWLSCGGKNPYWTDDAMPKEIGVVTQAKVYGVVGTDCRHVHQQVKVMRCSWKSPHDFVYRYVDTLYQSCSNAFCGMT